MHRFHLLHTVALAIFFLAPPSFAISIAPLTIDQQASEAEIIIRGTVESTTSYRSDGFIYSDTVIGVTEIFSGDAPGRITLTYRGGRFENRGETVTDVPIFQNGDDRIFFLVTDDKGFLRPYAGPESAPLTDQDRLDRLRQRFPESQKTSYSPRGVQSTADPERTITSSETEGLLLPPRRTITPDRGEPIGYLVDADFLPAGISLETALQAVESALSAWSEVSSVKFRFDGLVSFGTSARDLEVSDRRLRIQLHDIYGKISGSSVLGFGGQVYRWIGDFPDGGSGGRIYDTEFDETIRSFVVLSHTASSMENPAIFEGVLAHEIGHALGLGHSSEDPNETDPDLRNALMFFQVRPGGGSDLNSWDIDAISRVHPLDRPPFGFDRFIRAVTSSRPLANDQVNRIRVEGYSLYAEEASPILIAPTNNSGTFQLAGTELIFEPNGLYNGAEIDPGSGSFYDQVYIRYADGTHLSPPVSVSVIALLPDTAPTGDPDGLPDEWMESHFGSRFPASGLSGPHDDPDGDGVSNIEEFLSGTDPLDSLSKIRITDFSSSSINWTARPYDLYEIEGSTDLINWKWIKTVQPTTASGSWSIPPSESMQRYFYRVIRVD